MLMFSATRSSCSSRVHAISRSTSVQSGKIKMSSIVDRSPLRKRENGEAAGDNSPQFPQSQEDAGWAEFYSMNGDVSDPSSAAAYDGTRHATMDVVYASAIKNKPPKTYGNVWHTFVHDPSSKETFLGSSNHGCDTRNGYVTKFSDINDIKKCDSRDYRESYCLHLVPGPNDTLLAGFQTGYIYIIDKQLEPIKKLAGHATFVSALVTKKMNPSQAVSAERSGK
jgi:hypothetical protein